MDNFLYPSYWVIALLVPEQIPGQLYIDTVSTIRITTGGGEGASPDIIH